MTERDIVTVDVYDDDEDDDVDALTNEDLGLCPHGATDDEGCEEPGCSGGPEGWDPE